MPTRVHALLVVRPDGHVPADLHLKRTLLALRAQSRPLDALTIVICGRDGAVTELAAASGAEAVITAPARTSYAQALAMAGRRLSGEAVWLLAQDTAPMPEALARLCGALETAPSVAIAAPKLVRWNDPARIESLGETMTIGGRAVSLAAGEFDQGQHDAREDVLGADVRGLLVRTDTWRELAGIDTGLAGADEGLDLGVRARLRGYRVALAPAAAVAVAGDGVAGLPGAAAAWMRRAYAERTAALHRRLVYAPAPAVFFHWLSLFPLALLRSLGHILAKHPGLILPEWAAAATAMVGVVSVARARTRIRRTRKASWARLAPLRISRRELRSRLDTDPLAGAGPGRRELRFFGGGGAGVVLAALVVSVVCFTALLAWPVLGGGALLPLRATVTQLWADATDPLRSVGWVTVGPADPFSAVVAVLGSLWPFAPSRALVLLWLLALPLAALGGWFLTTRVSERPVVRALGAVGWAAAPPLLAALTDGRPTAVIVHLLLPWAAYTATVARRSWSASGVASILLVGVVAASPSLAPALLLVWILGLVLTFTLRRGVGAARVAWLVVPAAAVFAPLILHRLRADEGGALWADPGLPVDTGAGTALFDGLAMIAGYPTGDLGRWTEFAAGRPWWPLLFVLPLLLLAVLAPAVARLVPAALMWLTALTGIATASLVAGVALSTDGVHAVGIWPGSALSLYWLGILAAALATVDGLRATQRARVPIVAVTLAVLLAAAAPALSANIRGTSALTEGSTSTLPAYVEAEGRGSLATGTFMMTPTPDGGLVVDVIWGDTSALGGQSTLRSARSEADGGDAVAAQLAAALVSDTGGDAVDTLARHGIAYIMLAGADGQEDRGGALRLETETSLNQRSDLEKVGETSKGMLWRIATPVTERAATADQRARAGWGSALQGGAIAVALLLALPTRRSLASARRWPRVVGIGGGS